MTFKCAIILGLVATWLLPTISAAHRTDAAMSVIEISPRTGRLEVSHTLYAHDLEGPLGAGAVALSWFETEQGEAALKAYCLSQFTLTDASGVPIALSFVGVELRGGVIHVYFDAPRYMGASIIVDSNLLQETSDSQVNQVNVRANGQTISSVFPVGALAQRIALP